MKANEVITIGRRAQTAGFERGFDDALALEFQLARELYDQDRVLARQAHEYHEADLHERCCCRRRTVLTPASAESMHIGTIKITASGSIQLSYRAASTRKASRDCDREHEQRGPCPGVAS